MSRAPRQAVVDAGFLELLRYGMRSGHSLIEDSLRVAEIVLNVVQAAGDVLPRTRGGVR